MSVWLQVLPEDGSAGPAITLDMVMMANFNSQERTEAQYAALLESAGLKIQQIDTMNTGFGLIYACKA